VFFILSLFLFCAPAAYAQDTNTASWDCGRIHSSAGPVTHVFVLKNDSGSTLNVSGTHASCGCTVSKVDKKSLMPGEQAGVEVQFKPKGYSGHITQHIYVNTDSRDAPVYKFIIYADVIKD
ncbi:MAG: DUF1573 domain-containing protein, partial [Candidatus Omnitrophica bacterium]|nr:DUF1573 domain-containing protein [Candidatus Omnitrophota bacterium]